MIRTLELENFRCFRHLKVDLQPFTILIGPNSSGKSTLMGSLLLLQSATKYSLDQPEFWRSHGPENCKSIFSDSTEMTRIKAGFYVNNNGIRLNCEYDLAMDPTNANINSLIVNEEMIVDGKCVFTHQPKSRVEIHPLTGSNLIGKKQKPAETTLSWSAARLQKSEYPGTSEALQFFKGVQPADFRADQIQQPNTLEVSNKTQLHPHGNNLADVLDLMRDQAPKQFQIIEDNLKELVPNCIGLTFLRSFKHADGKKIAQKELGYRFSDGVGEYILPSRSVSAGLALYTAFVTLCQVTPDVSVILIEEPERGVHPSRLRDIVTWLRKISETSSNEMGVQVIVSTHSPYLLDWCKPEEVLMFYRNDDGSCGARSLAEVPNLKSLLEEFEIGELWTATNERQLLGLKGSEGMNND